MRLKNEQVVLVSRSHGIPLAGHFEVRASDVPAELAPGQLLVMGLLGWQRYAVIDGSMAGILVWDDEHRYEEAVEHLTPLVRSGALRYREDILEGLRHAPGSIADLYNGRNLGKRLIRLDGE